MHIIDFLNTLKIKEVPKSFLGEENKITYKWIRSQNGFELLISNTRSYIMRNVSGNFQPGILCLATPKVKCGGGGSKYTFDIIGSQKFFLLGSFLKNLLEHASSTQNEETKLERETKTYDGSHKDPVQERG